MAQLVVVRPVHFLPGREAETVAWAKETEKIRRQWGMTQMYTLKGLVDRSSYLLIQVWESREAYMRWKASPERRNLAAEAQRYVLYDPSDLYEVL